MSSVSSSSSNIASLCISDTTSLSSSSSFDSFVFYPIEVAKPPPFQTHTGENNHRTKPAPFVDVTINRDAASYLEQYRKPSSLRAKRHAESLIKSIKKWYPSRQLEAQPFRPQPIVAAVASVSCPQSSSSSSGGGSSNSSRSSRSSSSISSCKAVIICSVVDLQTKIFVFEIMILIPKINKQFETEKTRASHGIPEQIKEVQAGQTTRLVGLPSEKRRLCCGWPTTQISIKERETT
ncbi:hypothetical protein Pst134EB_004041 [Puccinia striiformis f. sp. tritici]|nr:hypothetical protein Pst134EB_004041 [Puccinia striiformis f. sp. tritici]